MVALKFVALLCCSAHYIQYYAIIMPIGIHYNFSALYGRILAKAILMHVKKMLNVYATYRLSALWTLNLILYYNSSSCNATKR